MNASLPLLLEVAVVAALAVIVVVAAVVTDVAVIVHSCSSSGTTCVLPFYYCYMTKIERLPGSLPPLN